MALYIIADLHLSASRSDLCTAFAAFASRLKPHDSLIISGDLFEFFVGEDPASLGQKTVREAMLKAKKRGIACGFQKGNRDFLVTAKEASKLNLTLLPDFYAVPSPDGPALVLHGDELCTNDLNYLKFKQTVSKPWLQKLFLCLPLALRRCIAVKMRKQSLHTVRLDEQVFGVVPKTLQECASRFNAPIIIHGHIHRIGVHFNEVPGVAARYVLGDWDKHFSYVRIDEKSIELVQKPVCELIEAAES